MDIQITENIMKVQIKSVTMLYVYNPSLYMGLSIFTTVQGSYNT